LTASVFGVNFVFVLIKLCEFLSVGFVFTALHSISEKIEKIDILSTNNPIQLRSGNSTKRPFYCLFWEKGKLRNFRAAQKIE
jgi:hypothetical protein